MADFTKASGNSMKGVELIAVIHNGRTVPKKTKDGKDTNEIGARFVDVMVDNSSLTADDIKAGKGQTDPNLYSRKVTYTDKTTGEPKEGYDNGIRFSENQVDAIKAAGGANILTKEDGTMYVPFKADLMNLKMATRDEAGNVIKDDKGAAVKKTVGLMPNTETLVPSDRGPLTQERLDAHFENTRAANAVAKAAKAAEKPAEKAAEAETKKPAKKAPKKSASKASKLAAVAETAAPAAAEQGMEKDPDMPFG